MTWPAGTSSHISSQIGLHRGLANVPTSSAAPYSTRLILSAAIRPSSSTLPSPFRSATSSPISETTDPADFAWAVVATVTVFHAATAESSTVDLQARGVVHQFGELVGQRALQLAPADGDPVGVRGAIVLLGVHAVGQLVVVHHQVVGGALRELVAELLGQLL
jgi:hypothetical protein